MTPQPDERRRILEETALLPEGDERRQEIMRSLDAGEASDREQWCSILCENEDLRLRLRGVETPPGLLARVRAVREVPRPVVRRGAPLVIGGAIAVLLLVAATVWITLAWLDAGAGGSSQRAMRELAMLAALDHAARPALSATTDNLDGLATQLPDAPFAMKIASPEPGAALIGGRICSFDDRAILYTLWHSGEEDVAVYQVRRSEFGFGHDLPPTEIDIPERGSPVSRCRVRLWTDGEFAFVIVHDRRRPGG